ncbi:MAG: ABC transporter substrate-binding protein, partial [Sphaerochaetaceae bacterium]|nr:ABC transporter substrate-binding protein [Sphaerochaetaceae bacterium]
IVASGADSVFLGDYLGQMLIAYDALRDAGFKGDVLGANTMAPPFADQVKNEVYGCYFLQNYDMLNKEVGNIYEITQLNMKEQNIATPQVNTGFGWDAVIVLTEAMKKAKDPTDGAELAALIAQTKDVELSGGVKITLNEQHRTDTMGMYIATYENKQMKIIGFEQVQ